MRTSGLLFAALLAVAPCGAFASTTAKFLLINPSPRVAALGNASTAACNDANAVFYIPSAMSYIQELKLAFSYTRWLEGLNHFTTFGVLPLGRAGAVGIGMIGFASGDIVGTSDLGGGIIQANGTTANALELAFMGAYSLALTPSLSAGTTLKLVSERLESETALAFAADLSVSWEQPIYGIKIGAAAQNLGTPGKFVKESFPLPLAFRIGGAYDLKLGGAIVPNVLFTADGCYRPDEGISVGGGAEVDFIHMIFLRAGYEYRPSNDSTGFKTGLGFKYVRISPAQVRWSVEFDYGIELFQSFSPTHFIQAKVSYLNFGDRVPVRQAPRLKAADSYMSNVGTYDMADPEYNKVLDSVPAHLRSAYNLACIAAVQGKLKDVLRWMEYIYKYDHSAEMRRRFENDGDFDAIRGSEEFKLILSRFDGGERPADAKP
jgi:hypothetical protein